MSKLNIVSKLVLPILLLGLLLGVGAGLALAGRSDNGEGGRESPIDKTLSRAIQLQHFPTVVAAV